MNHKPRIILPALLESAQLIRSLKGRTGKMKNLCRGAKFNAENYTRRIKREEN